MSALIPRPRRTVASLAASSLVLAAAVTLAAPPASAASTTLLVTEVYGGGGNSGAPYTNDFIELTNLGTSPVDVAGWSVQYASAAGTTWTNKIDLTGSVAPGAAYLVQAASGGANGQPLPTPDVTGGINMSATAGKVALVSSTTNLTCGGSCATAAGVVDFVGYGTAADSETAPAPAGSNTQSVTRIDPTADHDNNATDFTAAAPTPKVITGGPGEPPPATKRIHEVQGAAHTSPLAGSKVTTPGVVTAKTTNGFWFQDPEPDSDPATSEGLFVFTNAAPTVDVGDAVSVAGTVSEFRPGGSGGTDNLTTTELTGPQITVTGTAPVPAPTIVGPGGRVPPSTAIDDDASGSVENSGTFDPASDGIDFWESLEGMWLGMNSPEVTGPTSGFREIPVVPAGSSIRTIRGGIVLRAGDNNPERVMVDDVLAPVPTVKTGDKLAGLVTGVLDYSFGNFKWLTTPTPGVVDGGVQRETTKRPGNNELAVATFNVENLDPTDGPAKFDGLAQAIVTNLASPDIVALEEVQDNDGPADTGTVDANVTLDTLAASIRNAGGPTYQWRQINPVDKAEGGEPGGNIRVALLFRTDRGLQFVDKPGGGPTTPVQVQTVKKQPTLSSNPGRIDPANPAWTASRVPLAGEFSYGGKKVFVIANHFSSKGGDDPLWGRWQPPVRSTEPKRRQQATVVRDFVDQILAVDDEANVVVLGDLNDFDFSDTADILAGFGATELIDEPRTLPFAERYSYVFEGNSQILDHILISRNLVRDSAYDIVHMNSEFPDQISDHDPQVIRLRPR
jgi:uncharacterized protein